jgi:hypothetical protein
VGERLEIEMPNPDWLDSLSRQTREDQVDRDSVSFQPPVQRPGPITAHPVSVIVTGDGVDIDVPGCGDTGSGGTGSGGSRPKVYPGKLLHRNTANCTQPDKWYHKNENVWIEECNDLQLTVGTRYSGLLIGRYRTLPLISVQLGSGAGGSGTCTLPSTAEQLAANSPQGGGDPVAGIAAWTHGGQLVIDLGPECCYYTFSKRFCKDDGTKMVCERETLYFPFKVKVATGPVEENCPAPDWNRPCNIDPGSTDFSDPGNSGLLGIL